MKRLKEAVFYICIWPLIVVLCVFGWDEELLGGSGE